MADCNFTVRIIAINEVFGNSNFLRTITILLVALCLRLTKPTVGSHRATSRKDLFSLKSRRTSRVQVVGGSIDTNDQALRAARVDGRVNFDTIVQEHRGANDREAGLYRQVFANLPLHKDIEACLEQKLRGFETLLRTVDELVIHRGIANAARIRHK